MLLQEPVQAAIWDALNHYSFGDAIFLAERLNSEVSNNDTLHLLATCYYRAGKCNQAYMLLERSCCSTPQCKYLLARCCADIKKYAEAERLIIGPILVKLKSHEEIEAEFGSMACYVFALLGHIYSKTDRMSKAIACFKRALKLNPLLWKSYEMLCNMGDSVKADSVFQIPAEAAALIPLPSSECLGSTTTTTTAMNDQRSEANIIPSTNILTIENVSTTATGGSKHLLSPRNICTNQTPENQNQPWSNSEIGLKAPRQKQQPNNNTTTTTNNTTNTTTSTTTNTDNNSHHQQQHNNQQQEKGVKKSVVPTKLFCSSTHNSPSFGQLPMETPQPSVGSATPSFISPFATDTQKLDAQAPMKARIERRFPARGKAPILNWSNALKKMKEQETTNTPIRRSSRLFGSTNSCSVKENSKSQTPGSYTGNKPAGRRTKTRLTKAHQELNDINKGDHLLMMENNTKGSSMVGSMGTPDQPVVDQMLQMHQQSLSGILTLLKSMGKAYAALASYDCRTSIALFSQLPEHHYNTGWVLAQVGRAYYELTEYQRAAKVFEELRRLEPYHVDGLDFYSSVLWHLRKEVELSLLAQELQSMDKTSATAWFVTGNCFSLQKEHDVAIKFLQRAIQVSPSYVYAYSLLALEYIYLEEFDKALTCFRNAIRLDPRHYQAWYGVGMIYYKQEKFSLAEVHYRKALSINPSSSILMCHIGVAQHAQQKTDLALHTLNTAIKADPRDPLCMFHRASILFASDRHKEALEELESLKQIIPRESVVYFLMGKVHKKLGNTHLAMINFSWAMDLDPKGLNNQIKEAVDRHYVADDDDDPLARLEQEEEAGLGGEVGDANMDNMGGAGVGGLMGDVVVRGGRWVRGVDDMDHTAASQDEEESANDMVGGIMGLMDAADLQALESDESL